MSRLLTATLLLALTTGCACDRMGLLSWANGSSSSSCCPDCCHGCPDCPSCGPGPQERLPTGTYEIAPPTSAINAPPVIVPSQPEVLPDGRSRLRGNQPFGPSN